MSMSGGGKKLIKINRNEYIDRAAEAQQKFANLSLQLETIDSVLLLLDAEEESVLINVLRHIVQQARRMEAAVNLFKEKNLLQQLLRKRFFRHKANIFVKRLALHLASFVIENSNCLVEFETRYLCEILSLCLEYYQAEDDDFCCEYLSVIISKCLDDPQCRDLVLKDSAFIEKYFSVVAHTSDPDILLHSFELLLKLLLLQAGQERREFVARPTFPLNRLLCELNCEFFEIRQPLLKVLNSLLLDSQAINAFNQDNLAVTLLNQLTSLFCTSSLSEELLLLVEVLAAALQHDLMICLFFELNLFAKYLEHVNNGSLEMIITCKALWVFAECAKNTKFLTRLVSANITEKFLDCLFAGDNKSGFPILLGLNRLMASPAAVKIIIDSYDLGLLQKLLRILPLEEISVKAREQAAHLLENLLSCSFRKTAELILESNFLLLVAKIFSQDPDQRSTDLIVSLLNIIEMSGSSGFRTEICKNYSLVTNMGVLLKNSFATAVLVTHLFRCLCCLVVEEQIHDALFEAFLCSSIKRALQSSSNQVKSAVTNFIMQTTRFDKFMSMYNDRSVLEVLLLRQKHAFCVPTWQPAIESILSKNPTMKFCIRNCLDFVDVTVGHDFKVSKRKFNDFRLFECILREEVSPLQPVIVVNFNRPQNPADLVVKIPKDFFKSDEQSHRPNENGWCYCRSPGDEFLPKYLQEVNSLLAAQNLTTNPLKVQQSIDFDNLARRAKVIAQVVEQALGKDLQLLDLNATDDCNILAVNHHLKQLCIELHCSFIPLGRIRTGCKFERAILFKALADQIGLPCTLQRSVDGQVLFNELALPTPAMDDTSACDGKTLSFIPWRMLRPTHIVDLMYNVGELYPLQSRQGLQYLRLF